MYRLQTTPEKQRNKVKSTMAELRCPNRILFGDLEDGILEVKCKSARCGARPGVVVLHHFDMHTGQPLETKVYKNPPMQGKEVRADGTC